MTAPAGRELLRIPVVCVLVDPMRAVGQPEAPGYYCRFWARGLRDPAAPRGLFAPSRVPFPPEVGRRYLVVLYDLDAATAPGRPQDESEEGLA